MPLKILGEHPLEIDGKGVVFLSDNALITDEKDGHGKIFLRYAREHLQHLQDKEKEAILKDDTVSLEMKKGIVYIRPNEHDAVSPEPTSRRPSKEDLEQMLKVDEMLQEIIPKEKIKFLGVLDERVRQSIKERGELWRINQVPRTTEERLTMIAESEAAIGTRKMYYHSMETGINWLTYNEFCNLGELSNIELAKHLNGIRDYAHDKNAQGNPEVAFFMAGEKMHVGDYLGINFDEFDETQLRQHYEKLKKRFHNAVEPDFRTDNYDDPEWQRAMLSALISKPDEEVSEEVLSGLCPEFFMHIKWLPGARIEHGEVIFDPVFEKKIKPNEEKIYDEKVRDIIFNFVREYSKIEYINIGRVIESLSKRKKMPGRREVYIVEIKVKGEKKERKKIIRMQKFGAYERLESGEATDVHEAFWRAQEYKRYTLDRWIGCEQLGMNLLPVTTGEIDETIQEIEVPSIYFERDYIDGRASDKISNSKYQNEDYSVRFAKLLGKAAAPSIIVGRVTDEGIVLFDDGDEIIVESKKGLPSKILIGDITSSFCDYTTDLEKFAQAYAQPVIKRAELVPDVKNFAGVYIRAFVDRFKEIQKEYRENRGAFDSLFKDRKYNPESFAYRWEKVLERLDKTDADELGRLIIGYIKREIEK